MSGNLDIAPKSLKTWLALLDAGTLKASISVAKLTPDQLRIRELERELAIACEERDLLKKSTSRLKRNCRSKVLPHMASKWVLIVLNVCVRPLVFVASTNVNLETCENLQSNPCRLC